MLGVSGRKILCAKEAWTVLKYKKSLSMDGKDRDEAEPLQEGSGSYGKSIR